jgi:hypothetical protein
MKAILYHVTYNQSAFFTFWLKQIFILLNVKKYDLSTFMQNI